jgi:glycine/serine hydroxymethyltransferase
MQQIAELIDRVITNSEDAKTLSSVRDEVKKLTARFPLYENIF